MNLGEFNIIKAESCTYFCDNDVFENRNSVFNYIFVNEGTGKIRIADMWFEMNGGSIYMVPPYVEYSFFNSGEIPLKTFEIKFSADGETTRILEEFPFCMNTKRYPIKSHVMCIHRETLEKEPFFFEIVNMNFRLIITYLYREYQNFYEIVTDDGTEKNVSEINKVLDYIFENLTEDISLEVLADIAGFEKNYFLRKFKKTTQYTPMSYIKEKRLEKAKELLHRSDMNISQIALASGFKTVHYFSKVFYESTGIRPSDYRNSINGV